MGLGMKRKKQTTITWRYTVGITNEVNWIPSKNMQAVSFIVGYYRRWFTVAERKWKLLEGPFEFLIVFVAIVSPGLKCS